MVGKSAAQAREEMKALPEAKRELLVPHKTFPGNRPSNSLMYQKLTPFSLGVLLSLYEMKVFVQGCVWGVNSFDQWGVELGKQLAKKILPELDAKNEIGNHDASTKGLISFYRTHSKL
jgi:glucose-6-phosphate isomerase